MNWTTDLPLPGADEGSLRADFRRYFHLTLGREDYEHSGRHVYLALAYALRDRLMVQSNATRHAFERSGGRRTCYMSMEFLIGRTLRNAMLNLDLDAPTAGALESLGLELEGIVEQEHDAGLGNGGLGRLAACFLDSAATLGLPVMGYGLRYQYGMFRQRFEDGGQVEEPDPWLRDGHPWEIARPEFTQRIHFGADPRCVVHGHGGSGGEEVLAVPYDVLIPGYRNGVVNPLRLWSACADVELDLRDFNAGSYTEAVERKNSAERITMVLYPNDTSENGKELRLKQQYLLASASLKDTLRQWAAGIDDLEVDRSKDLDGFDRFVDQTCFQLNDTHPSIAVAELMRLLLDEHGLSWDRAWDITSRTMAYTNHTLLPEALECWPVWLMGRLLPRPLEIIEEINRRFLADVALNWPGDEARARRMSIIGDGDQPMVRMAHLAIVGCFSVNGVAALHSRLLREGLFADFNGLWPERFNNKTNGVTPRRWLESCNPRLSALITDTIGSAWRRDMRELEQLREHAADESFVERWHEVKQANKTALADLVRRECNVEFPTEGMFDVQVKRIHEYKRQLLNILHVVHLYARIKRGDIERWTPRCVLIGGKAAPGYVIAKRIIRFANHVARLVNGDSEVGEKLKLVFYPDYDVSAMEVICPGADLSSQISTAGKEASGTGNMKFMMNGAVTMGTRDGANIEILDAVGESNFFAFGLQAHEVQALRGVYRPHDYIDADPRLREVMDWIKSGYFCRSDPGLFDPLIHAIESSQDPWMTAADFSSFVNTQSRASETFQDREGWVRMCIANTAASGRFSSDRTITEYNEQIWRLSPITVPNASDVKF